MVDLINSANVTNSISQNINPSQATTDGQKLAEDFQQFLKLLTTQLQNQDPTEPLDTNEFTNQLVLFASVEQQIASNQNLENLVNIATKSGVEASVGYIGNHIEAPGNAGILSYTQYLAEDGETVETVGNASFTYDLARSADEAKVSILDAAGRVVFSGNGTTSSGKNVVTWDGTNSFTGEKVDPGDYYIQVDATDGSGADIDVTTYTTGRVSAVKQDDDGELILEVGNLEVKASDVVAVREST